MTDQPYDIDKLVADAEAAFNAVRSGATGRFGYSWVFIRDHGEAIIALARDHKVALDALEKITNEVKFGGVVQATISDCEAILRKAGRIE